MYAKSKKIQNADNAFRRKRLSMAKSAAFVFCKIACAVSLACAEKFLISEHQHDFSVLIVCLDPVADLLALKALYEGLYCRTVFVA